MAWSHTTGCELGREFEQSVPGADRVEFATLERIEDVHTRRRTLDGFLHRAKHVHGPRVERPGPGVGVEDLRLECEAVEAEREPAVHGPGVAVVGLKRAQSLSKFGNLGVGHGLASAETREERERVVVTYAGSVILHDVMEMMLTSAKAHVLDFSTLIDARTAPIELSPADLNQIQQTEEDLATRHKINKCAILVSSTHEFEKANAAAHRAEVT